MTDVDTSMGDKLVLLDEPLSGDEVPAPARNLVEPLLYAVLRSWLLIAFAAMIGAAGGLVWGLTKPNEYESVGRLYVRAGERESAAAEAAIGRTETPIVSSYEALLNEVQILEHDDVFRRVVELIGADRILQPYDPLANDDANTLAPVRWMHELQSQWFQSEAANRTSEISGEELAQRTVRAGMMLERLGNSRVILVRYTGSTPELARDVLDAFLRAGEEQHREVFSNAKSLEFLRQLDKDADEGARVATEDFAKFKREHGLYDPGAQMKALDKQIVELTSAMVADEELVTELTERLAVLKQLLGSTEPQMENVTDNPPKPNQDYMRLRESVADLRRQRQELEASLEWTRGEKRSKIEAVEAVLKSTEEELRQTDPDLGVEKSVTRVANPRLVALQQKVDEVQAELAGVSEARLNRGERLIELGDHLDAIKVAEPEFARRKLEVERRENTARSVRASLEEARLFNMLDESKLSNLRILERGSLPRTKSGPRRARLLLLGGVVGLVLGVMMASLRQFADGRVRRKADVAAAGVRLLGTVPVKGGTRRTARRKDEEVPLGHAKRLAPWRSVTDDLWGRLFPEGVPMRPLHVAWVAPDFGAGTTSMAMCTAVGVARDLKLRVLVVETNLVSPGLARWAGADPTPGLAEVLRGEATLDAAIRSTAIPGLKLLPAGVPGGEPAFAGPGSDQLFGQLSARADLVMFDLPPLSAQPDTRPMLWRSDRVIIVARHGVTPKAATDELVESLRAAGIQNLGLLLNRHRSVRPFWLPLPVDL
ncbi:MAG: hypothetical protein AAF628_27450 [Planctomycetota bacterium]